MLDRWLCDRADTQQHTPYAHPAVNLDTFHGGTSELAEEIRGSQVRLTILK